MFYHDSPENSSDYSSSEDEYQDDNKPSNKFFPVDNIRRCDSVFSKNNTQSNVQKKQVTFNIFRGTENPTSPLARQKLRATRENEYESLCKSSLALDGKRQTSFSPSKAHVNSKWGSTAKNWSFWTFWKPEMLKFTLPPAKDPQGFRYCEEDLVSMVNHAFSEDTAYEDRGWEPLVNDSFLAIRITQADFVSCKRSFTQEICIRAHQLAIQDKHEQSKLIKEPITLKLLACAGLAEIVHSVVRQSDVLIISGGYDIDRLLNQKTPTVLLNQNKEHHTQILRMPGYMIDSNSLCEKIEPAKGENRFKFTYIAKRGATRRVVEQYRHFYQEEFCRKVTDTFAYRRYRWDFPMPVMKETVAQVYELLCSPDYSMSSCAPSPSEKTIYGSESSEMRDSVPFLYHGKQRNVKLSQQQQESKKRYFGTGIPGLDKKQNHVQFSAGSACNIILLVTILGLLMFITIFVEKVQFFNEEWTNPFKPYFHFCSQEPKII